MAVQNPSSPIARLDLRLCGIKGVITARASSFRLGKLDVRAKGVFHPITASLGIGLRSF